MRTTVSIDDELLRAARRRAQQDGTTLGAVIDAALRRLFTAEEQGEPPPVIPVFLAGTGARAGIDLSSNRALHEALDQEQPLEKLR